MMQRTGVTIVSAIAWMSVATAQPTADARQQKRLAAETLERAAATASDPAKFMACGQAYLAVYNSDPAAADGDEILFNAAECLGRGKSVGTALQTLAILQRSHPHSKLQPIALLRSAQLYARIGFYDQAATRYEDYAKNYPGEKEALSALGDALSYRLAFGDHDRAVEDVTYLQRTYGAKHPAEVAEATFALIASYERRGGGDPLIAHLRDYLKRFDRAGGDDHSVLAMVRLGEELWHRACPVREVDGLCVKVVRERAAPNVSSRRRCGPPTAPNVVVVPRVTARAKEALGAFAAARKRFDARTAPGGAVEMRTAIARARLAAADQELEKSLALGFPKGLDFDPANPAAKASAKKLNEWLQQHTKLAGVASAGYEEVIALKDGAGSIAAAARLGQLSAGLANVLATAELPASIRTGNQASAKTAAYCDKLREVADPMLARAKQAFEVCLARASELGIENELTSLCARERAQIDPKDAPLPELFALPSLPSRFALEPAGRLGDAPPPAFTAAHTRFAETDRTGGWSVAACRANAAQFAAVVKANPTLADAQYMIGLGFHRCGLVDDARRAYEQTLKLRPNHAAATSNLGELQWRAGKPVDAKNSWMAALAIDGKLLAAHLNLAVATISEWRELPGSRLPEPARAKLAESARFHLSSALAIDDADPIIYLALATLELDRAPVAAAFYLGEAARRAPDHPDVAIAAGAIAARRGAWAVALDRLQHATSLDPSSSDAHLGLGLAALRVRRFDVAREELARVKVPSYDHHVATGIALRNFGEPALALAAYDRAIALAPDRAEAHFDAGLLHVAAAARTADLAAVRTAYGRATVAFRRAANVAIGELKADAAQRAEEADQAAARNDASQKAAPAPNPAAP